MARYIGPRCKLARREGTDLFLTSGLKGLDAKCKITAPPGQHGAKKPRMGDFAIQLRAKQKLKRIYGVLERQFRRYYSVASKKKGSTGENLLIMLECRLDNLVYRMGFGSTRAEARQLVTHKAIMVNGKITNIPSYLVSPGDEITIAEKAKSQMRIHQSLELFKQRTDVSWINVDVGSKKGRLHKLPMMEDFPPDYNVHLVVELYSK